MVQADMFGVCGRMTTQPGRRDEVVDLIREFGRCRDPGSAAGAVRRPHAACRAKPEPNQVHRSDPRGIGTPFVKTTGFITSRSICSRKSAVR
jgi:hypothetical protein